MRQPTLLSLLVMLTATASCATGMKERPSPVPRKTDVIYAATGSGHYIKAVGPDGQSVTLEDGSVWEIDPRSWFFTVHWQPLEGITIRRTAADTDRQGAVEPGFNYEIDNTDQDDGALARYRPP
jgi:hypothetical protein